MEKVPALPGGVYKDIYSSHFNILRTMGLWGYTGGNWFKKRLYLAYSCLAYAYCFLGLFLACAKLYISRRNLEEVSFNLSTNVLTAGMIVKNFYLVYHYKEVEKLRKDLYEDRISQTDPEEIKIGDYYKYFFLTFKNVFQYLSIFLFPIWLVVSLTTFVWGPREVPFSLWIPMNLENDRYFLCIFVFHTLIGIYVTVQSINMELGMFSLLFQTAAQYRILALDVVKIKEYYHCPMTTDGKINCNKVLVENHVRALLKKSVQRHLVINEYIRKLEMIFSKPLLLQLICVVVLMVMNGIILLMQSLKSVSLKGYCQAVYSLIITTDVFLICGISTLIFQQKDKVFEAICDLPWYEMSYDLQKELALIMVGLQINQTLTAWKIFKIDLTTFMAVMKTITSWLTLLWQIMRI